FCCSLDYIQTVISVCCELNRCITEFCFIICNKCLCSLIVCIRCKRCQEHQTFSKACVKSFHIQKTIHSVNTKPLRSKSRSVSLCQNQRRFLIVDRKEYELSS